VRLQRYAGDAVDDGALTPDARDLDLAARRRPGEVEADPLAGPRAQSA